MYIAPPVSRLPTGRWLSSKFGVFTHSAESCFSLVHERNKLRRDRAAAADSCCRKAIWRIVNVSNLYATR